MTQGQPPPDLAPVSWWRRLARFLKKWLWEGPQ